MKSIIFQLNVDTAKFLKYKQTSPDLYIGAVGALITSK